MYQLPLDQMVQKEILFELFHTQRKYSLLLHIKYSNINPFNSRAGTEFTLEYDSILFFFNSLLFYLKHGLKIASEI